MANRNQRVPFHDAIGSIWSCEGIARPGTDRGEYQIRYFRRTFAAPAGATLTCHISADSRYKLWFNGQIVGRGPAKGDITHTFYDSYELTPMLRRGRNVLAVQVQHYGRVWPNYAIGGPSVSQMTACPMFVMDGILRSGDGSEVQTLHTDARWRVAIDQAYRHHGTPAQTPCAPMQETFDASRYPWGFNAVGYDDSAWPPATIVNTIVRLDDDHDSILPHRLLPRMIANLEESTPRLFQEALSASGSLQAKDWRPMLAGRGSVCVRPGTSAGIWLDAAELTAAYSRIRFSGKGTITLVYTEAAIDDKGRKSHRDTPPPPHRPFAPDIHTPIPGSAEFTITPGEPTAQYDQVFCDGPGAYEPFDRRTFRFVYLEISSPADAREALRVQGLQFVPTAYPYKELATFACSEASATAIWDLCWRTARLCAHETFEDCPYYEQLQYGGDTQVQAMISYYVPADASLARQFLYQFDWSRQSNGLTRSRYPSRVPQTIPYWSLHWVMAVRDYWDHTGDQRALHDLLPGVLATMDYFHRQTTANGTIGRLDGWRVADWCPQWNHEQDGGGVPPGAGAGQAAFDSLITAVALADVIALVRAATERSNEAQKGYTSQDLRVIERTLQRRLEKLRAAAHRVYFDPSRGLYLDRPAGTDPRATASAYTNVWAILAGMPCDYRSLAQRIVSDKALCQLTFFSRYFACRALAKAGRYDLMPTLLATWQEMLQWGLTTVAETTDLATTRSDCHAWGAGPLVEYIREVLGVRPGEPGYAVIAIEPKPAGLTHARGRVPLTRLDAAVPARFVEVAWRIEKGTFTLIASSPKGIPCRVTLPDGSVQSFPKGGKIKLTCKAAAPLCVSTTRTE